VESQEIIAMTQEPQQPSGIVQPIPQTSTLAVVSLVTGIACWIILPLIGALIAIVTGHLAKKEIRASMDHLTGDGLATAGLVLGYLQIILVIIPLCLIVILALLGPSIGDVYSNIILEI
jgi:hypothetical protein